MSAIAILFLCVFAIAQACNPVDNIGIPRNSRRAKFCDFGRLLCDVATGTVRISNNTTQTSFDVDPTGAEKSRWYVYLDSDRPTDEELYAFYCDPTLKSPRLLTVPNVTAAYAIAGRPLRSIVPSSEYNTTTAIYRFSVQFVMANHVTPYGTVERLYYIYVNSTTSPLYLTILGDGAIELRPKLTPLSTSQLFVMSFEPFTSLPSVGSSEELNQAVDNESVKELEASNATTVAGNSSALTVSNNTGGN
ncbi:hypothetical protein B0H13DRAFT_2377812 [Mycena leptocephala]|nr:hypothetical protein B0H13DRAFT_2377812 [Mycena leptocephala]